MAIFHLETKPIQRSNGRSSVASSAYRNAIKLTDDRTGLTFDYGKKQHNVFFAECFMVGENGEKVFLDNAKVWNAAEKAEKRKDSRTAREVILNLPYELTDGQRKKLVQDFSEHLAKKYKVGIDFAIHRPSAKGDQRNHHAHILMTTRDIKLVDNEIVLSEKTSLELSNSKLVKQGLPLTKDQITNLRKTWEITCNDHLAQANIDVKIDSRSFKDMGTEMLPTKKMGYKATELERAGQQTQTAQINAQIRADNVKIAMLENEIHHLEMDLYQEQIADLEQELDERAEAKKAKQQAKQAQQAPKAPTPFDIPTPFDPPKPKAKDSVSAVVVSEPQYREIKHPKDIYKNANYIAHVIANYAKFTEDRADQHRGHFYDSEQMKLMAKLHEDIKADISPHQPLTEARIWAYMDFHNSRGANFISKYQDRFLFAESPQIEREHRQKLSLTDTTTSPTKEPTGQITPKLGTEPQNPILPPSTNTKQGDSPAPLVVGRKPR